MKQASSTLIFASTLIANRFFEIFDNILMFLCFFIHKCNNCIFHRPRKHRVENANVQVFKNKISKNIRVFLNRFCRNVCALCCFICFKAACFFYDLITFNLNETKKKLETNFSFIAIMLGCSLYFIIAFINGSSIF